MGRLNGTQVAPLSHINSVTAGVSLGRTTSHNQFVWSEELVIKTSNISYSTLILPFLLLCFQGQKGNQHLEGLE